MTTKGRKLLLEYENPKKAFYAELMEALVDVNNIPISGFSKDSVFRLLNYLIEDYKDLVLKGDKS